jgi:hypothetical protein
MDQQQRGPAGPSRRTLRLTFSYEGDKVSLVSAQSVAMITPPPSPVRLGEQHAGFWYELRDRQGEVLYQQAMHNPIRTDVEVFSDDPQQSLSRQPVAHPRGTFVLLVPDTPAAHQVALFSSPLQHKEALLPAKELAVFDIPRQPRREV